MKKIILILFLLAGCSSHKESAEIADLRTSIIELRGDLISAKDRISILEDQVFDLEVRRRIFLTPGSNGYQPIQTDLGTILISIKDIKPFGAGTKIIFSVGNLTTAVIKGFSAKIQWGLATKDGPQFDKANVKNIKFSSDFIPGSWTNTEVRLENVTNLELGFVRLLDTTHDSVSLRELK